MKILGIANTIMLHLEHDEAIALANVIDEALARSRVVKHAELFTEIVRQIDICLKAHGEPSL